MKKILILALACLLLAGCSSTGSPEGTIAALEDAINNLDTTAMRALCVDSGALGTLDSEFPTEALKILDFSITLKVTDLKTDGAAATATVDSMIKAAGMEQPGNMTIELVNRDGVWLISGIR